MLLLILKSGLFISLLLLFYTLKELIKERNISDKIASNLDKFNESYEKRLLKLRYNAYFKKTSKLKNFREKYDVLIAKSNIRKRVPFFTIEILFGISIVVGTMFFLITYRILFNIFAGLVISGFTFLIPIGILNVLTTKNSVKIENEMLNYMNTMIDFCLVEDNLIFAAENTTQYLQEPLRTFNECFVNEVKLGLTIFEALENFKSKIDNKRFKKLIRSLQLCSKYSGSYISVLRKSKNTIKDYQVERNSRIKRVRDSRYGLYAMLLVSAFLIFATRKINTDMQTLLRQDLKGQIIVAYLVFIYIFSIYKSLTLENFKY